MPFGMSWSRYLIFTSAALGSMFLGASVVHHFYKPNLVLQLSVLMCPLCTLTLCPSLSTVQDLIVLACISIAGCSKGSSLPPGQAVT